MQDAIDTHEARQVTDERDSHRDQLSVIKDCLEKAMDTLEPYEAYVLRQIYLEGRTNASVGREINRCTDRVCQIRKKALRKMRNGMRIRKYMSEVAYSSWL